MLKAEISEHRTRRLVISGRRPLPLFAVPLRGDALAASKIPPLDALTWRRRSFAHTGAVVLLLFTAALCRFRFHADASARGAIEVIMSIPNTHYPNVRETHDTQAGAPPIHTFGAGVSAENKSGGEVRVNDYKYRRVAPPPARPYRDLND
jgi:hypothetical protein